MREYLFVIVIAMILTIHVVITVWFIKELGYRSMGNDVLDRATEEISMQQIKDQVTKK